MTLAWVVGSGGMLGSALCRVLLAQGTDRFEPSDRFLWSSPAELEIQLARSVLDFASRVDRRRPWELYWAAGASTMGSVASGLATESRALENLLQLLGAERGLLGVAGALAFASSAGAIYSGSTDAIVSEETLPAPTTEYARAKLVQEELVRSFVGARRSTRALLARLSTLYGAGQSRAKQQGLIAHMARSLVRNQALHIYVPLDTVRDYLSADDAAAAMVVALRGGAGSEGARVKIIAAERATTIAEIVSIFRRIARRSPRIIVSANKMSALYPRRVQFRSVSDRAVARPPSTSLLVGISGVMRAERDAFVRGEAPAAG